VAARAILYGTPRPDLAQPPAGAVQTSPLIPGSQALEALPDGSAEQALILAPPGLLERQAVLAHALRVLRPGAALTALAPKDKGGARLRKELEAFGCEVAEDARRHHRICACARPEAPMALEVAIAAGAPRKVPGLGLWSQPGVFSWDRLDPGSALLLGHLPSLAGRGADLGCGVGVLARRILESQAVTALALVDIDRRAVDAARLNVADPRAAFAWDDVRRLGVVPEELDFVVTNPPFHDGGAEDRGLGLAFIAAAAAALRRGGTLWLVANRGLPYEAALEAAFARVQRHAEAGGYKVYEARR
jgi:16S rRNA (guanine1207-N2)-methyltransferase